MNINKDKNGGFLFIDHTIQDQHFLLINLYSSNTENELVKIMVIKTEKLARGGGGGEGVFIFDSHLDSHRGDTYKA